MRSIEGGMFSEDFQNPHSIDETDLSSMTHVFTIASSIMAGKKLIERNYKGAFGWAAVAATPLIIRHLPGIIEDLRWAFGKEPGYSDIVPQSPRGLTSRTELP